MEISKKARVWIYQSDRCFEPAEEGQILTVLQDFIGHWQAHGSQLTAAANILFSRFIVLAVDEEQAGATGCSIDKSVNLMKELEARFNLSLFDRFNIAYRDGQGNIVACNREAFEELILRGEVNEDTPVFNNLIQTVGELETTWEIPFSQSWHSKVFGALIKAN